MTAEPVAIGKAIDILDFGEDGEWLAAEGHHDLTAFLAAADAHTRELFGDHEESLPSKTWQPPKVTYYRPVCLEDCRKDIDHWHPGRPAVDRLGMALQLFDSRNEEGWVYPCDGDHPDADPWTEVRA